MIVGKLPYAVMETIQVPNDLMEQASSPIIETFPLTRRPFGDCWLTCCQATPHIDESFSHLMFLNLAVVSTHEFGQVDMPKDAWGQIQCDRVDPGILFLTDPRKLHWLSCRSFENQTGKHLKRPGPYVGIQWELPRRGWKGRVRKIIQEIGAIQNPEWHAQ